MKRVLVFLTLLSACRPPPSGPVRRLDPPAGAGALAPQLRTAGDAVLATWLEPVGSAGAHRLRFARLVAGAWSAPVTITEGEAIVASWADVPSVAEAAGGLLVAHWAEASPAGDEAYDVVLGRSRDGGRTWQRLGRAHDDGTASEHGFVSLVPEGDAVRAFWLDGRAQPTAMALRTALVREQVAQAALLDERVCDCCGTGAVASADGPLVVYRDRAGDEVRDISIVRRAPEGFTAPRAVHDDGWSIAGCPVNGPAVDARDRRVAVAWYTLAGERASVRLAFSDDGGARFAAPLELDAPTNAHTPLGRVAVALDDGGDALVSYLASEGGGQGAVYLRRAAASGALGPPLAVARTSAGRDAGFPRLARLGDAVLVAWTEPGKPSHLRAALIRTKDVPRGESGR